MADISTLPRARAVVEPQITTTGLLDVVLARAAQYRTPKWVSDLDETRQQYEGDIDPLLLASARQRFPMTGHRMPRTPFAWVGMVAFKGSTVYDETPTREMLDAAGDAIEDPAATKDFRDLVAESQLDIVMPEFDRVRYLAKSAILYVHSDSVGAMVSGKPPRTVVDVLWPQDILVIPHPHAPSNLQACLRLLMRTGDAVGSGQKSWMDWRRDRVLDDRGMIVGFGPWLADLVVVTESIVDNRTHRDVSVTPLWTKEKPYPLRTLPFFACHKGRPSGRPFMSGGGNLKNLSNTINASLMSEAFTIDMTAAPILVHETDDPTAKSTPAGPGIKVTIRKGENLDSLTQTSDLAGMRASNAALLDNLALTERQRPGSFTGDAGVESGVALKIKNLPAEKARREDKNQLRPFEEEEFLPGLVEVHDHWRGKSIGDVAAGGFRVAYPDPPDFETKQERQDRLSGAVDAGWITKERAATEADYYPSEEEARQEIATIDAAKAARMATAFAVDASPPERTTQEPPSDDSDGA
jgi:hypothetical protein